MKVLIIGCGYVGFALLGKLHDLGHEVYVATTSESKIALFAPYAKEVVLFGTPSFNKTVSLSDAIVVLVAPSKGKSYKETYLETALFLVPLLNQNQYLLYSSSTSVYEGIEVLQATEELVLNPPSENGKILLATESVYLQHPKTCVLRLAGIYGPGRELHERAKRLAGKEMSGTGDEPTNLIHQEDIVNTILYSLEHKIVGIFNLAQDEHPLRKELYNARWDGIPTGKGYIVDNKKIKKLGLSFAKLPYFPLER